MASKGDAKAPQSMDPGEHLGFDIASIIHKLTPHVSLLRLLALPNPKVLRHIRRLPTGAAGLRLGTAGMRLAVRRPSHPSGVASGYRLL